MSYFHTYHEKPPPLPDGERRKRFEFASPYWSDKYSNTPSHTLPLEILHTVREGWEVMRAEDPDFFCGLTLHGSLVKGRSHEHSDIDPIIYASKEAAPDTLRKYGIPFGEYDGQLHANTKEFIESRFMGIVGASLKQAGFPQSYAMSEVWSPTALPSNYFTGIIPRWRSQIIWCLDTKNEVFMPYPVDHLFHMRIGSGLIQLYRQNILDGIESLESKHHPDIAEISWQSIARRVVQVEEWNRNATIHFPQTVGEAREYFHL